LPTELYFLNANPQKLLYFLPVFLYVVPADLAVPLIDLSSPQAIVVKAFNTVFAANQSVGKIGNEQLTAFIAGDDVKAKQTVAQLTRDIGFDPLDCGSLKAARYLDAMAMLIIQLAFSNKMGTSIGYKLVKA
jgi:8-hydroxy-5-deazaflavin:NADPH oxidoreductase